MAAKNEPRVSCNEALELQQLQEEQQIRRNRILQKKALKKKLLEQERQQVLEKEELEKPFLEERNLVSSYLAADQSTLLVRPSLSRNIIQGLEASALVPTAKRSIAPHTLPTPRPRASFSQALLHQRLRLSCYPTPIAPPNIVVEGDANIDVPPLPFVYASSKL